MRVVALIPARCGSKGFVNKNIAKINNKTLIEYAVDTALNCKIISDVYISTDCKQYEDIALRSGAKSLGLRRGDLSSDAAKSVDVAIDFLETLDREYDYIVLLQPTSPCRVAKDIARMFDLIKLKKCDASVSVVKVEEPHPYKLKKITSNGFVESFIDGASSEIPRQKLPQVYALNGAIYITKVNTLFNEKTFLPIATIPYMMSININIDSEDDYLRLIYLIDNNKINLNE